MFRRSMVAAALVGAAATAAVPARAQRQEQGGLFDSGWRQVAAALSDLELKGAGVRVNNLVVSG